MLPQNKVLGKSQRDLVQGKAREKERCSQQATSSLMWTIGREQMIDQEQMTELDHLIDLFQKWMDQC